MRNLAVGPPSDPTIEYWPHRLPSNTYAFIPRLFLLQWNVAAVAESANVCTRLMMIDYRFQLLTISHIDVLARLQTIQRKEFEKRAVPLLIITINLA